MTPVRNEAIRRYGAIITEARTGRLSVKENDLTVIVNDILFPDGESTALGGDWLDRDEARRGLVELPFHIANVLNDDRIETALDATHKSLTEAFVLSVHGINRYDFTAVHAEEQEGKLGYRTNPDRLRGGPKLAFDVLKEAGVEAKLTTDPHLDFGLLGGTRLIVPITPLAQSTTEEA